MNILFVSPSFNPFDGKGFGATQRTNLLFEACTQLGHVDVVTFVENVTSNRENCKVIYSQKECTNVLQGGRIQKFLRMFSPWNPYSIYPKNKERTSVLHTILTQYNYDIIVCHYIYEALSCGLFEYAEKLVIDIDDSPIDDIKTAAHTSRTLRNRLYHQYLLLIMDYFMKNVQKRCRFTFYANPEQAIFPNSAYLPNIPYYDFNLSLPDFTKLQDRLLFVGNLSYGPNNQGIKHFLNDIWPIVKLEMPNVEFHIVGGCNDKGLIQQCQSMEGVKYMGFVDDIEEEYKEAKLVVVPIYNGSGTNIKVLEAMNMHRPCITTPSGMRGFFNYFVEERDIVISQSDFEFAQNIIKLLSSEDYNHQVAQNGFQLVKKNFSRVAFNKIVKQNLIDT